MSTGLKLCQRAVIEGGGKKERKTGAVAARKEWVGGGRSATYPCENTSIEQRYLYARRACVSRDTPACLTRVCGPRT